MNRFFSFTAAAWLIFMGGCGGGLEQGYTKCGGTTCSPGQYCLGAGLCDNGCTSDDNCQSEDECIITDEITNEGSCFPREDVGGGGGGGGSGDPLADCQAACDHFQSCGLSASEASQCRGDCAGISENQQIAIANCDGLSCGDTLDCLGVQCFSDDDCSGGRECFGYACY